MSWLISLVWWNVDGRCTVCSLVTWWVPWVNNQLFQSAEILMADAQCVVIWLFGEYHELMTNYFILMKCWWNMHSVVYSMVTRWAPWFDWLVQSDETLMTGAQCIQWLLGEHHELISSVWWNVDVLCVDRLFDPGGLSVDKLVCNLLPRPYYINKDCRVSVGTVCYFSLLRAGRVEENILSWLATSALWKNWRYVYPVVSSRNDIFVED